MSSESESENWEDEEVSEVFDDEGAAVKDNKEVVWPVLKAQLKQYAVEAVSPCRILDFGCGAGQLAYDLAHENGYKVVGLDPSRKMIARAEKRKHPQVEFSRGTSEDLDPEDSFDAIASSLVLPFIHDLGGCVSRLSEHLLPDGIFAFATFNPAFVSWQKEIESELFVERESGLHIVIKRKEFRVFVHSAGDYEDVFAGHGLYKLAECYLVFSGDVPSGAPLEKPVPRFLMMAFRKVA